MPGTATSAPSSVSEAFSCKSCDADKALQQSQALQPLVCETARTPIMCLCGS